MPPAAGRLLPPAAVPALACLSPVQVGQQEPALVISFSCTRGAVLDSRADSAQRAASLLQVLLTGEPALVSLSAALLEDILRSNPDALASLYQTGAFFFALAYCGSNLAEIAQLFRVRYTHDMSCALSGPPAPFTSRQMTQACLIKSCCCMPSAGVHHSCCPAS